MWSAEVRRALETASYLYIATRRANGQRSDVVPVWFMYEGGDTLHFTSMPTGHKVRRLRRGSPLLVWVGTPDGPHFEAPVELSSDPDLAAHMGRHYRRKYWIAWLGFFRPRADRVRDGKTIIIKVLAA